MTPRMIYPIALIILDTNEFHAGFVYFYCFKRRVMWFVFKMRFRPTPSQGSWKRTNLLFSHVFFAFWPATLPRFFELSRLLGPAKCSNAPRNEGRSLVGSYFSGWWGPSWGAPCTADPVIISKQHVLGGCARL